MVAMSVGFFCKLEVVMDKQWTSLSGMGSENNSRAQIFGQVPGLLLLHVFVVFVVVILFFVFSVWGSTSSRVEIGAFRLCFAVRIGLVDHKTILLCYQFVDVLAVFSRINVLP